MGTSKHLHENKKCSNTPQDFFKKKFFLLKKPISNLRSALSFFSFGGGGDCKTPWSYSDSTWGKIINYYKPGIMGKKKNSVFSIYPKLIIKIPILFFFFVAGGEGGLANHLLPIHFFFIVKVLCSLEIPCNKYAVFRSYTPLLVLYKYKYKCTPNYRYSYGFFFLAHRTP